MIRLLVAMLGIRHVVIVSRTGTDLTTLAILTYPRIENLNEWHEIKNQIDKTL